MCRGRASPDSASRPPCGKRAGLSPRSRPARRAAPGTCASRGSDSPPSTARPRPPACPKEEPLGRQRPTRAESSRRGGREAAPDAPPLRSSPPRCPVRRCPLRGSPLRAEQTTHCPRRSHTPLASDGRLALFGHKGQCCAPPAGAMLGPCGPRARRPLPQGPGRAPPPGSPRSGGSAPLSHGLSGPALRCCGRV